MTRIVRGPAGVQVDPTGKMPGRGAYLHNLRSCWERGLKGALGSALKCEITIEERERLIAFAAQMPDEDSA
jgi:predicted RNA-binding protein YlxR (DUF448 family)